MKAIKTLWVNRLAALGLVVGLTAGFSATSVAQSVAGQAYGTYVNTPVAASSQSPLAVLPAISGTDGDIAYAEADASGVPGTPDASASAYAMSDRKSTRLNSSHVRISYAVFCLKKNNRGHVPPQCLWCTHHEAS